MKLVIVVLLLVALASIDCGGAPCNAACTSFASGTGAMTGNVATATDTTVCIDGDCSTVAITLDFMGDATATYTGAVTGTLKITPAGAITLSVTAKSKGFNDGDVYGLLVNAGAAGTLVAKTSAAVTYDHVDVCGNTCKQASFTF